MNNEPWIGDASGALTDKCTWSQAPHHPTCDTPATVHVLTESAIYGLVTLRSCDLHATNARHAGLYVDEHAYGPNCRANETIWQSEGCEAAS